MTVTVAMTMEEDEDAEIEHVYVAHEIDLDYEFDAARFFDFNRPETPVEAHQAELWFQNAPNYPPSPFVAKLAVREEFDLVDVNDSTKSRNVDCMSTVDDDDKGLGPTVPSQIEISDIVNGHTSGNKATGNSLISNFKPAVLKGSTLMKPTATQLARKNRPAKNVASRFRKPLTQNEMNLSSSSGVENQSAKRQKLEGGHLCKVSDVKQQTDFVHKTPMRAVTVEQNSACSKLKLTIPREPDLKTAHRAQRIRPKVEEAEQTAMAAPRFKARPLNRRILDAPSLPLLKRSTPRLPEFQEFHLKTLERAMQHTSATSSSLHCNDSEKGWDKHTSVSALEHRIKDARRPTAMGAPKHDGLGFTHIFKAQPLHKKILSNKEHASVVQTNKEEITVPMEFDLHTEKGIQQNPPIELFSKLSLTSEGQPNNGSHFQLPQQSRMCRKEKAFTFGAKKIHHGNGGCHSLLSARRSLGIR
ncbi:protein TPX2-like [Vicia villosa]|uniref:protein TPX2-like n=1 Tax=Vicia villosa TaxID=3911 RepID=UPI00273C6739|nr:protein TPX2-like [Vicia villosa]